jgi:hypothetical protein
MLCVKVGDEIVWIGACCDAEERPAPRQDGAYISTDKRTQRRHPRHPRGACLISGQKRKTKREAAAATDHAAKQAAATEDTARQS